jgi:hypothetical protein
MDPRSVTYSTFMQVPTSFALLTTTYTVLFHTTYIGVNLFRLHYLENGLP